MKINIHRGWGKEEGNAGAVLINILSGHSKCQSCIICKGFKQKGRLDLDSKVFVKVLFCVYILLGCHFPANSRTLFAGNA